jgi:uncharacterized RDD family membrane protein YckC
MADVNYFLCIKEAQAGPYTWGQVKALLAEQSITPETLLWKEGMPDWQPLVTLLPAADGAAPTLPIDTRERVFTLWRRLGALVIDWLILSIGCHLLGFALFDFFCSLGSLGPWVGLGIAVMYFGVQNSVLCGGQTLGKRLLGIEVVDYEGHYISFAHSMVRYLLLGLPFFAMDPMIVGGIITTFPGLLSVTVMSFWIAAITYLFIFNVPSRQSFHDRIVDTYVVRTTTKGPIVPSPFWILHYVFLSGIALITVSFTVLAALLMHWGPISELLTMQKDLQDDGKVAYASFSSSESYSYSDKVSKKVSSLEVNAYLTNRPDSMDEAVRSVANTLLHKESDALMKKDVIRIQVSYGYDIGITSSTVSSWTFEHSPQDWQRIIASASNP